jgi:hypothetical protein
MILTLIFAALLATVIILIVLIFLNLGKFYCVDEFNRRFAGKCGSNVYEILQSVLFPDQLATVCANVRVCGYTEGNTNSWECLMNALQMIQLTPIQKYLLISGFGHYCPGIKIDLK